MSISSHISAYANGLEALLWNVNRQYSKYLGKLFMTISTQSLKLLKLNNSMDLIAKVKRVHLLHSFSSGQLLPGCRPIHRLLQI